jgi:tetratricopeptide (TPR) repeat protein
LKDRPAVVRNLHQLGLIAYAQGAYEEARSYFQQSLENSQELDIGAHIADNLERLGVLAHHQGDYERARCLDQESRSVRDELEWMEQLPGILAEYFDEGQVRAICLEVDVDYDNLPGDGYAVKARELVITARRSGQLRRLRQAVKEWLPDVPI